jgi:ankyrin repeat protein
MSIFKFKPFNSISRNMSFCHAQVARALVAAGADVDLPDKASAMTPLHYGAMGGHLDIIDSLIGTLGNDAQSSACSSAHSSRSPLVTKMD